MKATLNRLSSLEARLDRRSAEEKQSAEGWAYFEDPHFVGLSEADQIAVINILQRVDQAFNGSLQDALTVLSDAELYTLETFVLSCVKVPALE